MKDRLVIVFVKGGGPGEVKTRLAKSIGDEPAYAVYQDLLNITATETSLVNADKWIFYTGNFTLDLWPDQPFYQQEGKDLGERMADAFQKAFKAGYQQVILIGSDLPDLTQNLIEDAFNSLQRADVVFGPASDGGYYLIGLTKMHLLLFEHKPWSTSNLLQITREELQREKVGYVLLEELNDIDTDEDYVSSSIFKQQKEPKKKNERSY